MKRILSILYCLLISAGCIKEDHGGADLQAGDMIPDFEVVMSDGKVISDDALKGSVSVVMFFHTSCSDCQQVLPLMQRIYGEYAPNGVLFALISRDEGKRDIDTYWEDNGLDMPYSPQNGRRIYQLFAKERIPRIYINEKGGVIRHIFTDDPVPSYEDIKDCLDDLLR